MKRILIVVITAVTLIAFGLAYYSVNLYQKNIVDYALSQKELFVTSSKNVILSNEKLSNFIFDAIVNNEEIGKLMYKASKTEISDRTELAVIRKTLYDKLIVYYDFATQYDFRQIQFFLINGDSFLRFNNPDKYGDNLTEVRPSIRISNEESRYVEGFEGGRVFNGYRFVYPLTYEGIHVGGVEISISMKSILNVLSEIFPDKSLDFILKKDIVERILFKENMSRYYPSKISDEYVVEEDIFTGMSENPNNRMIYQDDKFMDKLKRTTKEILKTQESFCAFFEYNGSDYMAQFAAVRNIENKHVAYLISIGIDKQLSKIMKLRNIRLELIALVYLLLIAVLLIAHWNQRKIYSIAMLDQLTNIYNRYSFFEFAHKEIARSNRLEESVCFAILDIDHFKKVNDKHGHAEGDDVLKTLVKIVKKSIRESDVFARYGGEEFIIMFPKTSMEQAAVLTERIREIIESHSFPNVGNITVSIGFANREKDESVDSVIKRADYALYTAKKNGRNQVCPAPATLSDVRNENNQC